MTGAIAVKAASAVLLNDDARKKIGWIVAAILSPLILLLAFMLSLASGSAEHNTAAARLCFEGGDVPDSIPTEYQEYIDDMRRSFSLLDDSLTDVNAMTENGDAVDTTQVKAIFYALYFGDEQPSRRAVKQFVDCFVTYETRTRTVTNDDSTTTEGSYTVAVPVTDKDTIWQNVQDVSEISITEELQSNAENIYALIRYGWTGSSGWSEELGQALIGADGFVSPLGSGWENHISSEFGYRICPYHGRELHSGIDIAVAAGTPIRAALDGTVIKSYYSSSYGNFIVIDHGGGLTTGYAHQSKRLVKVGDTVEVGEVIGLVGSTGKSTGPHLHFEVRVNGEAQNPRYFLPQS